MQNERKSNLHFFIVSLKKRDFLQMAPNIVNIYRWKVFFTTSTDSRSLPQNKVPFGLDQGLNLCLRGRTYQFFRRQNYANFVSTCSEFQEESKTIEISQRRHQSWLDNSREAHGTRPPLVGYSRCPCASPPTTIGGEVLEPGRPTNAARVVPQWPEHSEPDEVVATTGRKRRRRKR